MVFTFLFVKFGQMHIFLNQFFDHQQVMMPPTSLGCQDGEGSDASGALYRCSVSWNPIHVSLEKSPGKEKSMEEV